MAPVPPERVAEMKLLYERGWLGTYVQSKLDTIIDAGPRTREQLDRWWVEQTEARRRQVASIIEAHRRTA
jgi:hypothetical protein